MRHYLTTFFLLFTFAAIGQYQSLRFDKLNAEDGLTQNTITGIVQDQKGFVWIATQDGLNRYDGFVIKRFMHSPTDSNTISHNIISSMLLEGGNLWIGLDGKGLSKLNIETEDFTNYINDSIRQIGLSIFDIYSDQDHLWLATNKGLYLFDKKAGTYEYVPTLSQLASPLSEFQEQRVYSIIALDAKRLYLGVHGGMVLLNKASRKITRVYSPPTDLPHYRVIKLLKDKKARIWIGTYGGLQVLYPDGSTKTFTQQNSNLPDNRINSLLQDSQGNIWVGTYNGLALAEEGKNNNSFHVYQKQNNATKYSLSNNRINSIYEDRAGTLWVGSYFGGVNKTDLSLNKFQILAAGQLSSPIIRAICKDSNGNTWIGTQHGLNKIDKQSNQITKYFKGNSQTSLASNIIRSLLPDKQGNIWIGTSDGGLNRYIAKTNNFQHFKSPSPNINLESTDVRVVYQDDEGNFWMGTSYNGAYKCENIGQPGEKWSKYSTNSKHKISGNSVTAFCEKDQNLWISTWNGLNRINKKTGEIRQYTLENSPSMANNSLKSVMVDHNNTLWIATAGSGIQKIIDPDRGIFKTYNHSHGLPNNYVYAILADQDNDLWASTNKGITKFNPTTETFRNYDVSDGLQDNEFNTGAYYKSKDGQFFFGGIKGLNAFYPDEIQDNNRLPQPVITKLKVFNKDITIGHFRQEDRYHLDKQIAYYNELELDYSERVFSLYFSAMHYAKQSKNQFAYKMDGFDEEWNFTDASTPFATYTNLPAKSYKFMVKAANNDGVWNDTPVVLEINIQPPFWQLWYIRLIALLTVAIFIHSMYLFRMRKIAKQKIMLENIVSERTQEIQEKNHYLEQSKEELSTANEELKAAYEKLAVSEGQLRVSEEEIRQYNDELITINANLNETTHKLEEALIQEKKSRQIAEKAHTDLQAAEVQLIQREKMAALGTLTAGIAHEVNNPVNYVVSGVYALDIIVKDLHQILLRYQGLEQFNDINSLKKELKEIEELKAELQLTDVQDDCLTILGEIKKGADRVLMIVKGLLNFSRLNESSQKMANIHEGIDSTLVLINGKIQKHQILVEKNFERSIPKTYCHPSELNQVFMSIIINAIEASQKKSKLIITTKLTDDHQIKISIKDFGEGISPEVMPKIFDPFYTTKDVGQGKGLGLSSSLGIIQKHGGDITLDSELGKGTEVHITIPINHLGKRFQTTENED